MSTKPSIQPLDSDKYTKIDVYSLCVLVCCSKGLKRSLSLSMASLTVETALGSFDFLNSSDLEEEDEENKQKDGNGRSVPPECSSNVFFFSILHVFFSFLNRCFSFEQLSTGITFGQHVFTDFTLDHRLPFPRLRPSGPPEEVQFTTIGTISLLNRVSAQYVPFIF